MASLFYTVCKIYGTVYTVSGISTSLERVRKLCISCLNINNNGLRLFTTVLLSLNEQHFRFQFWAKSLTSLWTVFPSMNMKNLTTPLCEAHSSSQFEACHLISIICLSVEYLSGLGIYSVAAAQIYYKWTSSHMLRIKSQDCYYFSRCKLLINCQVSLD